MRNLFLQTFFQSEFLRNVLVLMTGTGLAALITLCASPFLTRIFSPAEFGVFASYASVVAIIAAVSAARYDVTIVLPKADKSAHNLMILAFGIVCLITLVVAVFMMLGGDRLFDMVGLQVLHPYRYSIPVMIFAAGLFLIVTSYANRIKAYGDLARSKIIDATMMNGGGVGLGIAGFGVWSLIVMQIVGRFCAALYVLMRHRASLQNVIADLSQAEIKTQARYYDSFPKYSTWGSMVGALASNIHIILFLAFYGDHIVGIIALATRILGAPLQILSGSFSQVFYEKISRIEDTATLRRVYVQATQKLSVLAGCGVIVVMLCPSDVIGVVFGAEWGGAMSYLRIMVFWFAAQFVAGTVSVIYTRLLKEIAILWIQVISCLMVSISIILCVYYGYSVQYALLLCVASKVIVYLMMWGYGFVIIQRQRFL